MNILAGDIGGTKTLLAVFSCQNELIKLHQKKYSSKNWVSLEPMIKDFMETLPSTIKPPRQSCLAIAGPVSQGRCRLTNLNWSLNEDELRRSLNLDSLELINDVCVLIYGIPSFKKEQFIQIQHSQSQVKSYKRVAIIAAGTGLGISKGVFNANQVLAFPTEGGHQEFSPRSITEWEMTRWLKSDLKIKRLSLERIVSGIGLGHIARWRLNKSDAIKHPLKTIANDWPLNNTIDLPSLASTAAKNGDKLMQEALQIWLGAYGSAAGDLALSELCEGGLWIAGGAASKNLDGIKSHHFLESMKNKGRFSNYVSDLPVMALVDPEAGLFSAACRARMLAESNEKLS